MVSLSPGTGERAGERGNLFVAVSLLLLAVAAVACLIPARRATEIHPMVALRGV